MLNLRRSREVPRNRLLAANARRIIIHAACCLAVGLITDKASASTWTDATSGGLWTTSGNWSGGVPNSTGAIADFSTLNITADNVVHLNGSETVGSLLFGDTTASNNWVLDNNGNAGNVLTLGVSSGAPTITVNNQQVTITAAIGGTQGLTDAGPGALVLAGANIYTGTTTINSGSTLAAFWSSGGAFGVFPSGASIVDNGALILTRNATDSQFMGIITGSGTTTISGDGGYLNLGNGGDGVARLSASGDLTLNIGLNLFKNAQTIGALSGNGTITSNSSIGGAVALKIGNNGHSGTFSGVIDNAGSETIAVTKLGNGTQAFTGANTYTGGTTISGGTLQLGDGTTSNGSIVGNVTDNATLAFANPNSQSYAGVISGSGTLVVTGPGTLTLGGANTFTGSLSVTSGSLIIPATGSMTGLGGITIGSSGISGQNAIVRLDGAASVAQSGAANLTVGTTLGSSGTLNIGTATGGSSFTTGTGTLTINPTGAVNIGAGTAGGTLNANGNITVNGGELSVAIDSTFNVATGKSVTVLGGGSATIAPDYATGSNINYTVAGQGSLLAGGGLFFLQGGSQFNVQSGGGATFNVLYAGNNAGPGTVTVGGAGSSLSAGTIWVGITSTGTVNVNAGGSMTASNALNLTNGAVNINGGAANFPNIVYQGGALNFIAGSLTTHQNLEVASSGLILHAATSSGVINGSADLNSSQQLTTTGSTTIDLGQTLTLDGGALTTGSLIINGSLAFNSGTLGITGAGGLTIGSGGLLGSNLTLATGQTLNISQSATVSAGSTLNLNGGSFSAGAFVNNGRALDGGSIVLSSLSNNAGAYFFVGQNLIATASGASTNAGEIQLGGADATLTGASTLTNTGLIHGDGHLAINVANSPGGKIRVENGSVLNFDGSTTANAGNVSLLGGAATFAQAFTNGAAGTITGHGGLIFNAGFTNQGTMQLSSGGTDIYGTVTNSGAGSITTGSGSITTFYNNVTHSGAQIRTAVGGFTVFFGNVQGAGPFTGPGTVDFEGTYLPGNAGANVSFASNVTLGNTAAIVMNDGGTTEITGVPSFNSGSSMTVNNGILRFNVNSGAATVAAGVTATIASGATLELAGSVSALSSGTGAPAPAGRVNIVNNSAAPGLLVSGTHQQVSNIDGSGTTQVNAGSDLTSNHIIQGALIIGGTLKNPGLVTIDASDSNGNPLAKTEPAVSSEPVERSSGDWQPAAGVGSPSAVDGGTQSVLGGVAAIDGTTAAVPEPASLVLMSLGIVAWLIRAARARRSRA